MAFHKTARKQPSKSHTVQYSKNRWNSYTYYRIFVLLFADDIVIYDDNSNLFITSWVLQLSVSQFHLSFNQPVLYLSPHKYGSVLPTADFMAWISLNEEKESIQISRNHFGLEIIRYLLGRAFSITNIPKSFSPQKWDDHSSNVNLLYKSFVRVSTTDLLYNMLMLLIPPLYHWREYKTNP